MDQTHSQSSNAANVAIKADDIIDFAQQIDSQEIQTPEALDIATARFSAASHTSEIAASDTCTLFLSKRSDGRIACNFEGVDFETKVRGGLLTFVPHGLHQHYDFQGTLNNYVLTLDKDVFTRVLSMGGGLPSIDCLEPRIGWYQPGLQNLVEEQHAVLSSQEAGWRIVTEANAMKVAVDLLRMFGREITPPKSKAALSQAQVNMLTEYIDAEIDQNFGITVLSDLVGTDPFQFSRAFKMATNLSPHQYVIHRRILHAQALLETTAASLAEIAYDCGFSSQSLMTSTFTKHVGFAPGAYRNGKRK